MAPDAVDEDELEEAAMMDGSGPRRQVDPDASYRKDPKKALRHYLESKGYSCEFEVEESGPGHAREYTARIRLPIETSMGPVYGEATTGRRRDAEREAALDACIQLDSRGMLNNRSSSGEGIVPFLLLIVFVEDFDCLKEGTTFVYIRLSDCNFPPFLY
jgi:hypothetical protein